MSKKVKPPRSIRLLTQYGVDALRPALVNGRYIGPMIPRRKAADLKKRAIIEGTYGEFTPNVGGWNPDWEIPRKMYIIKPDKGHSRERTREQRYISYCDTLRVFINIIINIITGQIKLLKQ